MPVLVFAGGEARAMSAELADRVVGLDVHGNVLVPLGDFAPDYLVPLTPCCYADGKGSANSPTGVCCRACYRAVDAYYGGPGELASAVLPFVTVIVV